MKRRRKSGVCDDGLDRHEAIVGRQGWRDGKREKGSVQDDDRLFATLLVTPTSHGFLSCYSRYGSLLRLHNFKSMMR